VSETRLVFAQRCVFCAEMIVGRDEGWVGLLISFPEQTNRTFPAAAHLECLRRATHPDMADRLDKSVREQEEREIEARLRARVTAMPWWQRWRSRRLFPRER